MGLSNIVCILRQKSDRYETQTSNCSHFENTRLVSKIRIIIYVQIVVKKHVKMSGKSYKRDYYMILRDFNLTFVFTEDDTSEGIDKKLAVSPSL